MSLPLHHAIQKHWEEHRPQMVASLRQRGQLDAAINQAVDRTAGGVASLRQQGVPPDQAWERTRSEWAFLPSEQDVPDEGLPNGHPATWLPATTASPQTKS